jgi:hypothetical protein
VDVSPVLATLGEVQIEKVDVRFLPMSPAVFLAVGYTATSTMFERDRLDFPLHSRTGLGRENTKDKDVEE